MQNTIAAENENSYFWGDGKLEARFVFRGRGLQLNGVLGYSVQMS